MAVAAVVAIVVAVAIVAVASPAVAAAGEVGPAIEDREHDRPRVHGSGKMHKHCQT
ncbi:MAG TPA: hypothetical protein VF469_38375 [Kofleriaceae bacterium]